jgi:predicted TIM-barrel fold metal-dependent hydrolase
LDISGIPPKTLLKYFPRLQEIAHKTLFGTDWPGPGVPEINQNLDEFRALPLPPETQQQILSKTALGIWPA